MAAALQVRRPPKNTHLVFPAAHGNVSFAALVHPSLQWPSPRSKLFARVIEPTLRRNRHDALRRTYEAGPTP